MNCYNQNYDGDLLTSRFVLLYIPFNAFTNHKLWQENSAEILSLATLDGESSVELFYPSEKRTLECVVTINSLMPIIMTWRILKQKLKHGKVALKMEMIAESNISTGLNPYKNIFQTSRLSKSNLLFYRSTDLFLLIEIGRCFLMFV